MPRGNRKPKRKTVPRKGTQTGNRGHGRGGLCLDKLMTELHSDVKEAADR